MAAILWSWAGSAFLLVLLAGLLGTITKPPCVPFGILIDSRGRYSLTHTQPTLWKSAQVRVKV